MLGSGTLPTHSSWLYQDQDDTDSADAGLKVLSVEVAYSFRRMRPLSPYSAWVLVLVAYGYGAVVKTV